MNDKFRFQYVRDPNHFDRYIGVICFWKDEMGALWGTFSKCHPKDRFCKKTGRNIALARAKQRYQPVEVPTEVHGTRCYPITDTINREYKHYREHLLRKAQANAQA